jgi:hypothetical protein
MATFATELFSGRRTSTDLFNMVSVRAASRNDNSSADSFQFCSLIDYSEIDYGHIDYGRDDSGPMDDCILAC